MNKYWLTSIAALFVCQQSFADTSSMDGKHININGSQTVTICGEDRVRLSTNCIDGTQNSLTYDAAGNLFGVTTLSSAALSANVAFLGLSNPFSTDLSIFQPTQLFTSNDSVALYRGANDPNSNVLYFIKSRALDSSADVIVQNNDAIMNLSTFASDGATFRPGGGIILRVSATPGVGDMPTQLEFWTTLDGTATASKRFTITTFGDLVNDTGGGSILLVKSGTTLGITETTPATACMGTSTPNGATPVTVTTSCAVTNARVFFTRVGATPSTKGVLTVTSAPNGTNFQYTGIAGDTEAGSVVWWIMRVS